MWRHEVCLKKLGMNGLLTDFKSDHREHSEWQSQSRSCPFRQSGQWRRPWECQTGSQRSSESTGTVGNSKAGAGRRELYYGGSGYLADRTLSILFKLNHGYLRQNQQFPALEREAAILAARRCTPLDAAN